MSIPKWWGVRPWSATLLGFAGPKAEAEQITQRLAQFLRDDLRLELSKDKTLITHARTGAARFLGYEITTQHYDRKVTRGQRHLNGQIGLRVPRSVIKTKCAPYLKLGKPERQPHLVNDDAYTIIKTYGAAYRGLTQYYLLAGDVWRLGQVHWVMLTSMLKMLACKYDSTVSKTAAKYAATVSTPHGPRRCFQTTVPGEAGTPLVARFGGIPLRRQNNALLTDRASLPVTTGRKELITRLLAGRCEVCKQPDEVQVHHVGTLADLTTPGQPQSGWRQLMAKRRRKTLVVCQTCHDSIHTGQPTVTLTQ